MKNRILVVEDERAISDLICMNLQAAGYLTGAVYDGDAVERYVDEEPPFDLALVDVMLLDRIWGSDFFGETRTVDVHIAQMRKKLNLEQTIRTIPKLGYRLEDNT